MKYRVSIKIRKEFLYTEVDGSYELQQMIEFMVKKFKNQIDYFKIKVGEKLKNE